LTQVAGRSAAPVAVVGAGIAGLVAAAELRRNGYPVVVFEAGSRVAGLAGSQHDDEGYTYDTGAHFITNRLAGALGVSDACRDVRYYRETVWLGGHTYSYPLGLVRVPRFVGSALATKARRSSPPISAEDWFRAE
jgi:oxygen-dependent protoporphyrinogen oxidase